MSTPDSAHTPKFLDIHVLHTLPYSNVNRDDLGSPKTLVYGGHERTRISSQSWKRVVRHRVAGLLQSRMMVASVLVRGSGGAREGG